MITPDLIQHAMAAWDWHFPDGSQAHRNDVIRRYCEPHRHYHTLTHIMSILKTFDSIKRQHVKDPKGVLLAIWYHDVIYDPFVSDNEAKSADLMNSHWRDKNDAEARHAQHIIVSTQQHISHDNDAKFMHDMDLAILGSSPQEYKTYVSQVRQEYKHLSDRDWTAGRLAFMTKFVQKTIYQTDHFGKKLEVLAKTNIKQELVDLEKTLKKLPPKM
jgi:predicted metal-dependent HD superfamily phosphohydrolase